MQKGLRVGPVFTVGGCGFNGIVIIVFGRMR